MASEPASKRVHVFIDGQNLFKAAAESFGSKWPDYDATLLATHICKSRPGWNLHGINFYTGIPPKDRDEFWHGFWARKLAPMGRRGVSVFTRDLRYQRREIQFGHGGSVEAEIPVEKGIDVRIAIDVIRLCLHDKYDVAVIFSQDQDLSEVADEIQQIAKERDRWIKIASAFPGECRNQRGIAKTDWIKIDRATYELCKDHRDYRPK